MEIINDIILAILLGLIQGFTEPLPISSSGHLVLAQRLLSLDSVSLALEMTLNFASLVAVIFVYRKSFVTITVDTYQYLIKRNNHKKDVFELSINVVIGTVPAALIGLFLLDIVETWLVNQAVLMVGIGLVVTGIFLGITQFRVNHAIEMKMNRIKALGVGISQLAAIIPGISRSGSTFLTGVLLKVKPQEALKFSFLLYVPISFAALILSIRDLGTIQLPLLAIGFGFIASFIATYAALQWFFRILERKNYFGFMLYCLGVGGIAIVMAL